MGYIELPVSVGYKTHTNMFFIAPSLKEKVYLGIDFWRIFDFPGRFDFIDEQEELDLVKEMFPSFNKEGLGRSNVHEHEIILIEGSKAQKQRYYPLSPAVQENMYKEIDRMLDLNVIDV